MTALFDGVAGLLSDVFGSTVTLAPQAGFASKIQAVIRSEPVPLIAPDGRTTLDMRPEMRVTSGIAAKICSGDSIITAAGKAYKVVARQPSGSPAEDAMVIFDLEVIE
jgi:hypothetical protein